MQVVCLLPFLPAYDICEYTTWNKSRAKNEDSTFLTQHMNVLREVTRFFILILPPSPPSFYNSSLQICVHKKNGIYICKHKVTAPVVVQGMERLVFFRSKNFKC